jgi:hypothetical protein
VLVAHTAREEPGEQIVALDTVVEGPDEPPESILATGPLEERRRLIRHVQQSNQAYTIATPVSPPAKPPRRLSSGR